MNKYLVGSLILLIADLLWINVIMKKPYRLMVSKIQKSQMNVNMMSAMLAYLSMIIILNYIIIRKNFSLKETFILSACVYAVYDFTAGAVFKDWDFKLAVLDVIWGGCVFTLAKFIVDKL